MLGWAVPLDPSKERLKRVAGGATVTPQPSRIYAAEIETLQAILRKVRQGGQHQFQPPIIHFPLGQSTFSADARKEIQSALSEIRILSLKLKQPLDLQVSGHADKSGDSWNNQDLAVQRANRVAAALEVQGKGIVRCVKPHGCGDEFASGRLPDPRHRVAVIRLVQ